MFDRRNRMLRVWIAVAPTWSSGPRVQEPPPPVTPEPSSTASPPFPEARHPLPRPGTPSPPAASGDPLNQQPWIKLVGGRVDLFDELDRHLESLDPAGRQSAEHACLRLQEIQQRCGVELIDPPGTFERVLLHQPVGPSSGLSTGVVCIISPAFPGVPTYPST